MKDSISIFRKLINFQLTETESISIPIGEYDNSIVRSGKIHLYSSCFSFHIFKFINLLDDFMIDGNFMGLREMDDSSLILSYGKGILDRKLIEKYNSTWNGFANIPKLEYKDFNVFLNL